MSHIEVSIDRIEPKRYLYRLPPRDNVFVERLWRSVKYEEVYLRAYDSVSEARTSIGRYLDFYNPASQHPSGYVVEGKKLCWSGCDPAGYLGFRRARSAID